MKKIVNILIGIVVASVLVTMTLGYDDIMSFRWLGTSLAIGIAYGVIKIKEDESNE